MFGFHVTIPGFSNCFQFRAEALILIAISPIAYHEGVSAFVLLVSYLSAVTLVKAPGNKEQTPWAFKGYTRNWKGSFGRDPDTTLPPQKRPPKTTPSDRHIWQSHGVFGHAIS